MSHRAHCCFCEQDFEFTEQDFRHQVTSGWYVECPNCGSCIVGKSTDGQEWLEKFRKPALHFVGFRGDEYVRAVLAFGQPDFIHPTWDVRARDEIVSGDLAVFAKGSSEDPPRLIAWNDSERF